MATSRDSVAPPWSNPWCSRWPSCCSSPRPSQDDALCFVLADVIGHASGVAYLGWRQRRSFAGLSSGWSWPALGIVARKWIGLPLYNLPGAFLALAFVMSPLLITPLSAAAVYAGHVALAYRIFDVPTQIITASSTPIFLHRLRPVAGRAGSIFGRHLMLLADPSARGRLRVRGGVDHRDGSVARPDRTGGPAEGRAGHRDVPAVRRLGGTPQRFMRALSRSSVGWCSSTGSPSSEAWRRPSWP